MGKINSTPWQLPLELGLLPQGEQVLRGSSVPRMSCAVAQILPLVHLCVLPTLVSAQVHQICGQSLGKVLSEGRPAQLGPERSLHGPAGQTEKARRSSCRPPPPATRDLGTVQPRFSR